MTEIFETWTCRRSSGEEIDVIEWVTMVLFNGRKLPGSHSLALENGSAVNWVNGDDDAFEILATGEIVRKIN